MLNSKPNNSKYNQGNFIPENKDKVLKLNTERGVYYRSGYEKVLMRYFDLNEDIIKWGGEIIQIPYELTHFENGMTKIKNHVYHTDFYYEIKSGDSVKKVVVEVKPQKEYNMVIALNEKKIKVPEKGSGKRLKNFEYDMKMAYRNKAKWEAAIKWCAKKGYEFIIVTEQHLSKFNVRKPKK